MMRAEVVLPLAGYLLLVLLVSLYAMRRRGASGGFLSEYFLGGRSMGGVMLAMTLTTTYVSASSFIGGPGAAYKYGLGWVLLAMIQLPAVWLSLGILGKKFAILARRYHAVTLNDMLYARYQSRLIVWLASLALLVAFVGAMTVQFIGGARLLESAAGLSYESGLLIFAITVALYTSFGGFRASVLNDAMQGIVMLLGTVLLLVAIIHAAGGMANAVQTLRHIDPGLVSPQGAGGILSPEFMASFWVLVCFGVIGLPHTAVRCISYKDSGAMHRGMIVGTVVVAVLMLGMHLSGALGRAVLPQLQVPDQVIPSLMIAVLPPVAAGIFLAAPMAAIMSTVSAQLLQSSATLISDLWLKRHVPLRQPPLTDASLNHLPLHHLSLNNTSLNHASLNNASSDNAPSDPTPLPDALAREDYPQKAPSHGVNAYSERRLKWLSVGITLLLSVLLLLAAWRPPQMIIWLNLLAFGGLQAVFLWPLVLGLYWRAANASGALCAMVVGAVLYTSLAMLNIQWLGFHPIVPSLLGSLLAFLLGNYLEQPLRRAKRRSALSSE